MRLCAFAAYRRPRGKGALSISSLLLGMQSGANTARGG